MSRVGLRSRSEAAINRAAGVKVARDEKRAAKKSRLRRMDPTSSWQSHAAYVDEVLKKYTLADLNVTEIKWLTASQAVVAKHGKGDAAALMKVGFEANATLPQVVEILKSELNEIQHATSERMKAWAERAAVLVDVFQLKQEQAAAKLGRSQPWVSAILKWRRDGYRQTAFGPQAKQARLVAPNKPSPPQPQTDTVVRGADGKPLDTSGFVGPAAEQLKAELAKANGTAVEPAVNNDNVITEKADYTEAKLVPDTMAPRVLSPEDASDDALVTFKAACIKLCPVMSETDLAQARIYVSGSDGNGKGSWRPRNAAAATKKAA